MTRASLGTGEAFLGANAPFSPVADLAVTVARAVSVAVVAWLRAFPVLHEAFDATVHGGLLHRGGLLASGRATKSRTFNIGKKVGVERLKYAVDRACMGVASFVGFLGLGACFATMFGCFRLASACAAACATGFVAFGPCGPSMDVAIGRAREIVADLRDFFHWAVVTAVVGFGDLLLGAGHRTTAAGL